VTNLATTLDRPEEVEEPETIRKADTHRSGADLAFRGFARGAGFAVLAIMVLVGGFLALRATDALKSAGWSFFTVQSWDPDAGAGNFGILAVLVGTMLIAGVAISIAIPLSIGTALYISEYAPRKLRTTLTAVIDLMAAVPSVIYGLWGFFFLQWQGIDLSKWLAKAFGGWLPFLAVEGDPNDPLATETMFTSSTFIVGIVVALMITPIAASIMREVFSQTPMGEREGAYALGATRTGMVAMVVLPFGRGGIIGGLMLGLGRALGETIAVYMIISLVTEVQPHILQNGGSSISALIASRYGDASGFGLSALMAAGLVLFLFTLIINFAAASIVSRSRSGAASDG